MQACHNTYNLRLDRSLGAGSLGPQQWSIYVVVGCWCMHCKQAKIFFSHNCTATFHFSGWNPAILLCMEELNFPTKQAIYPSAIAKTFTGSQPQTPAAGESYYTLPSSALLTSYYFFTVRALTISMHFSSNKASLYFQEYRSLFNNLGNVLKSNTQWHQWRTQGAQGACAPKMGNRKIVAWLCVYLRIFWMWRGMCLPRREKMLKICANCSKRKRNENWNWKNVKWLERSSVFGRKCAPPKRNFLVRHWMTLTSYNSKLISCTILQLFCILNMGKYHIHMQFQTYFFVKSAHIMALKTRI